MSNEDIKQLITSNAKAIEALTHALTQEREERQRAYQEWEKDRNHLYQYMGRIASAQAGFYEIQADYYYRLEKLENKQAQTQETIAQMQETIIKILNRIAS